MRTSHFCRSRLLLAAITCTLALQAGAATENKPGMRMYRYKNDQGVVVTSNRITPEYARKGYEIVNMGGAVLQVVPPEPTAEERVALAQAEQNKLSEVEQLEHDKQLLLRYSSEHELQVAKERKLLEIDNKVKVLQSNLGNQQQQLETTQRNAADLERAGREVPAALRVKIEELQKQITASADQLRIRQQELADESVRFDKELERYRYLEQKHGNRQ